MAGVTTTIDYIAENGTTYRERVPLWAAVATGDTHPSTAATKLPKGFRRRHRYIRHTADGKEMKLTVGDISKIGWTNAFNVTVAATVSDRADATGWVWSGRTGERDKNI